MKILILALTTISILSFANADDHKTIICQSDSYKLTTYQSPTAQDQVVVLVQKDELAIFSQVYDFVYIDSPVQAWALKEVSNPENSLAIVATSEKEAVADIKIDLGKEEGILKVFGASCTLDAFANN